MGRTKLCFKQRDDFDRKPSAKKETSDEEEEGLDQEDDHNSLHHQQPMESPQQQQSDIVGVQLPASSPFTQSSAKHNSSATHVDAWIARLTDDTSLAKPGKPLTEHLDHSGGIGLWNEMTNLLDRGLQRLSDSVSACFVSKDLPQLRQEIQVSVLALYYVSLEAVLAMETQRLGTKAHPKVLADPVFHKSLLAVASECILYAKDASQLSFPHILAIFEVDGYDFSKVCECFVRAVWSESPKDREPLGLPLQLRQHLTHCEAIVLDKCLWETNNLAIPNNNYHGTNSFFDAIELLKEFASRDDNKNTRKSPLHMWPPLALISDKVMNSEQKRKHMFRVSSWIQSNFNLNSKDQLFYAQHYKTVSFMFRKIVTLAARRVLEMSELLRLNEFVTDQIWVTFREIMVHSDLVHLLKNRHLDQLVLCTVYGVCKIARFDPEVSFAKIIESYYEMNSDRADELNQAIIRHIPIGKSKPFGNIIHMYNELFIPCVKQTLMKHQHHAREQRARSHISTLDDAAQVAESTGQQQPPFKKQKTDAFKSFEAKCKWLPIKGMNKSISPCKIEGTNIYVSSLCHSKPINSEYDTPDLEMERQVYEFGKPDSHALFMLNRTINYPNHVPLVSQESAADDSVNKSYSLAKSFKQAHSIKQSPSFKQDPSIKQDPTPV